MKKFETLEHKADLRIRVSGGSKEELFENALIGMFEGAGYQGKGKEEKRKIRVSSPDSTSLLVDFLSEALYLSEVNREVYRQVKFGRLTDKDAFGTLIGKRLGKVGEQVKGVTYHGLEVSREKGKGWEATILFDI